MANMYESPRLLEEYLLFHYGSAKEILPWKFGPVNGLDFAIRCVSQCVDRKKLPKNAAALDLGCAVGRSSFELSRYCRSVLGIDASAQFIRAAKQLQIKGKLRFSYTEEGSASKKAVVQIPKSLHRNRVDFFHGDAMELGRVGTFDVVLTANLIDRLPDPRKCLAQLPGLINPSGQLVITSPYTWMEEFTPRAKWLCGSGGNSFQALRKYLSPYFRLVKSLDLPFVIREHARKYQWSVAQATVWQRKQE